MRVKKWFGVCLMAGALLMPISAKALCIAPDPILSDPKDPYFYNMLMQSYYDCLTFENEMRQEEQRIREQRDQQRFEKQQRELQELREELHRRDKKPKSD